MGYRKKPKPRQKPQSVHVPYPNGGARFIGTYDPHRNLYVKRVRESAHLFRKSDSWGIDAEYFTETLKAKDTTIRVLDIENDVIYQTQARVVAEWGEYLTFKGHRAQIFLPRHYWDKVRRNPATGKPESKSTGVVEATMKAMEDLWNSVPDTPRKDVS